MSAYSEFSDLVERGLCCRWRYLLNDMIDLSECVDSVVFTQKDGSKWSYSFALRFQGRWIQVSESIEPFEYDIFDRECRSPNNVASDLVSKMIDDMEGRLKGEI